MKSFVKKHKRKIIAGHGVILVFFLLTGLLSLQGKDAVMYFVPYGDAILTLGETDDVDINISTSVPMNAVGTTVEFPEDALEIVAISKKKSLIDLWTEEPGTMGASPLRISGGTLKSGGFVGVGTVVTLTIRAKKPGEAMLSLKNTQVIASDGKGSLVDHETRQITYVVPESAGTPGSTDVIVSALPGDFDNSGTISIADVSILMVKILMPYDQRYDLNGDGSLGLADVSALLSSLGKE